MQDIFDKLKADHDKHRKMLKAIADTSGDTPERRELFDAFKIEVSAHANAEEQSLYAVMLANPDLQDEGRHSVAEHKELDDMLAELDEMDMAQGGWLTRFKTLRHRYEHHIEEEETEIFVAAQDELSSKKAVELGKTFSVRKPEEVAAEQSAK